MAKCARCHQRKAKRHCPALGMNLCPLCCGLIREKKIHCPPGCIYLTRHKPYQEKKIIQKKESFSEDAFQDERLNWLALHIEAPIAERAQKDGTFTDKDVLLALEYAREKVEKGKSRLLLPVEKGALQNETGEDIFESIERCRYQRALILPQEMEDYKKEEKLRCLENVMLGVKYLAGTDWEGRKYLRDLIRRFSKIAGPAASKKLLLSF